MDHEDILAITEYITKGVYPRGISKGEKRSMRKRCQSFALKNGVLYHHGNKHRKERLVVSDPQERTRILDTMHRDSEGRPTHNGIKITHNKVSDFYWWRGITEDVKNFVKRCTECAQIASANPTTRHSDPDDSDSNTRDQLDPIVEPLCIAPIPVVEHRELTSTSHSSDLVTSLRRLFEERIGFDVVLSAGGFQVSAHKVILMAASDYLRSMIVDQEQPTTDQNFVLLTNISGLCLEPIVTFLYTGTLRLSQENVHLTSAAAAQLGITSAVALCERFLAGDDATSGEEEGPSTDRDINTLKNDHSEASSDGKSTIPAPCSFIPMAPDSSNGIAADDFIILNIKEEVPAVPMLNLEDFVASVSAPTAKVTHRKMPRLQNCFVSLSANVPSAYRKSSAPPPLRVRPERRSTPRYGTRSTTPRKIPPEVQRSVSFWDGLNRRASQKTRRKAMVKLLLNTHGHRYACYVCESAYKYASGLRHHERIRHGIPRLDLALYRLSQMSVRAAIRSVLRRGRKSPAEKHGKSTSAVLKRMAGNKVSKRMSSKSGKTTKVCPKIISSLKSRLEERRKKKTQDGRRRGVFDMWAKVVRYERTKHGSGKKRGGGSAAAPLPIFRNRCGWCGRTFLRRADLLEHRRLFHKSRKKPESEKRIQNDWSCPERSCEARPKTKEELKTHMSSAHPNVFLSCPHCKYKTQVDHYLKRHLLKRHRERHICPICSRSYHKMCLLRTHMYNQHKVEDPSLKLEHCTHEGCNYVCPGKWALKTHMLKHTVAKPFTCDKCGRDFKRALSLEKHINKIHLGIRGYMCDKCGGSFADESELKRHAIRHDKNKAFVCAKCPFQSYIKAAFQSHMFTRHQVIVNDRMQLFKCDQCAFSSDRRYRYTEHIKKHANIRDIPCPECGKLFVTPKTMRQHIVKVHKQTTIYCALCPFRTLSPVKLREHIALMHDVQGDLDAMGSPDNPLIGTLSHSHAVSTSHRNPTGTASHRRATKVIASSQQQHHEIHASPVSMIAPSLAGNPNTAPLNYSDVGPPTMYAEAVPSSLSLVRPLMLGNQCTVAGFAAMMPSCELTSVPMSIENSFCTFNTFNGGSSVR